MIRAISPERELDQILSRDVRPIEAEFVIFDNTLSIQEHAVDSYAQWLKRSTKRTKTQKVLRDREAVLGDLHDQLSSSFIAKKKNGAQENIAFRFCRGFLFVLEWKALSKSWLLKTAFRLFDPRKRGFTIQPAKKNALAPTWSPSYSF
jgi:hypothetical protein